MTIDYYRQYEPIFGSWHIVKEIGLGSYGRVFEISKGESGKTDRSALKVITIPRDEAEWDNFAIANSASKDNVSSCFYSVVETYKNEIELMTKLKGNSHIVHYEDYEIIEHVNGKGWDILIRMELLTPLYQYMNEKGDKFSEGDVVKLGKDICKALEACEKCGVLHRNIKPENILVSETGDFKLGDFSVARIVEITTGASTRAGANEYMAPEVYKGESRYDNRADIYSLGMTMYRLLNNGRLPFLPVPPNPITFKDKEKAIKRRIMGDKIPRPSEASQTISDIVLKACEYDKKNRFDNAHLMYLELSGEKPEPKRNKYYISIACGLNGATDPSGTIKVCEGDDVTIQFYPDEGYTIASIEIDDVISYSKNTEYSFNGITRDHAVYVSFKKKRVQTDSPKNSKKERVIIIAFSLMLLIIVICVVLLFSNI